MKCQIVKGPGGSAMIICGSRRQNALTCAFCSAKATRLCDFVVEPRVGHVPPKTCDKPLCTACAVRFGTDSDSCPDHPIPDGAGEQLKLEI